MKEAIQHLKKQHPYPEDVFIPVPKEDWKEIHRVLEEAGFSGTKIFGHMARIGYNSAISNLEDL